MNITLCKMNFSFSIKIFSSAANIYKRKFFLPVPLNLTRSFTLSQNLKFWEDDHNFKKVRVYSPIKYNLQHEYFRNYLLGNSNNYPSIFIPEKILPNCNNNRVLNILREFKTNNEDDALTLMEINNVLKEDLNDMSENDLLIVSYVFANSTFTCSKRSILEVVNTLNDKFYQQKCTLSVDSNLRLCDALFSSTLFHNFSYIWKTITKYCYKLVWLNPKQVVHLAYLLTKFPSMPAKQSSFHFQDMLHNILPKLNPVELGIICYSLRKMQLNISHPQFYSNVFDVILHNIESLNDNVLTSVSEALFATGTYNSLQTIETFQEKIIPHINRFSLSTLTSLALSGTGINQMSQSLALKIFDKAREDLPNCNINLLQRLAFIMVNFNVKSDELIKEALEKVKTEEITSYNSFVFFTKYLICLGVLNEDLIKKVLAEEHVAQALLKDSYKVTKLNLGFIDNTAELEIPNYKNPRLSDKDKLKIWRIEKSLTYTGSERFFLFKNNQNNNLGKIENDIQNAYGPNKTQWKQVIYCEPHTIVMRFDKDLMPQIIPEEYNSAKGFICRPLDDDHIWAAVFSVSVKNLGVDKKLDFMLRSRLRHYEKIGYKPLPLLSREYLLNSKNDNFKSFFENEVKTHLGKFCN